MTWYPGFFPKDDRLCIHFRTGGWPHLVGFCFTHNRLALTQTLDPQRPAHPLKHGRKWGEAVCNGLSARTSPVFQLTSRISPSFSAE